MTCHTTSIPRGTAQNSRTTAPGTRHPAMMSDRLRVLLNARQRVESITGLDPRLTQSWLNQIDYVLQVASGETTDLSRLRDITIGVQVWREINGSDQPLTDLLVEVDAIAADIARERGV